MVLLLQTFALWEFIRWFVKSVFKSIFADESLKMDLEVWIFFKLKIIYYYFII